jgi:hypothetical protein
MLAFANQIGASELPSGFAGLAQLLTVKFDD